MEYVITSLVAESEWKFLRNDSYLLRRVSIFYSSRHRQTWAKRRIPQSYHPSALQSNSTRTLHTQSLSPRSGIGPRHQLYVALSGLTSKGKEIDKEATLVS
jgi:hypothetical protein